MTESQFRARLAALGITLDDKAFAAAFQGVLHLRDQVARIEAYLAAKP